MFTWQFFLTTRVLLLMILSTGWSLSGSSFLIRSTLCRGFLLITSDIFPCTVESLQRWWECTRPSLNLEEQESNLRVHANKESGIWARRLEQELFSTYRSPWVRSPQRKKMAGSRHKLKLVETTTTLFGRIEMIGGCYFKVNYIL